MFAEAHSHPSVSRIVGYWTRISSCRFPHLKEDFHQELWWEAFVAYKKWDATLGPLESYLFRKLRWVSITLQDKARREASIPNQVDISDAGLEPKVGPREVSYGNLLCKVLKRMEKYPYLKDSIKVFQLLTDPPSQEVIPFRETKPRTKHLNNQHVAELLCLSASQVYRIRKNLACAVREVLNEL
jgi:DNA-directed RNA polymerase specialized sigma24 family protein